MKKICVITGTRAEFGLLRPLIKAINEDNHFESQLVVTGTHLSAEFGYTIEEIEQAGFKVDRKLECLLSSDSAVGVSKTIGLAVIGFADVYQDLHPDLIVVLGDRTEILASVIAGMSANIPVAHLHGGETTEGAYDEGIRHAITKFSHLHFTSTEKYRKRVIQLGEQPNTVYNVGAIGLDSIKKLDLLSKEDFEKSIDCKLKKRNFLITYHPVTLEKEKPIKTFQNILDALKEIDDALFIFTFANSDKNGRVINEMIESFVGQNPDRAVCFKSLGQLRYLSALQYIDVVVGNSSSGIIEVPYFNKVTINIGDRQKGREYPQSVLQVGNTLEDIKNAIDKAFLSDFVEEIQNQTQIHGNGNTTENIIKILKNIDSVDLKKSFYNIEFDN